MIYYGFKGQSAIEYLMTYGWMLLVVAVVGGAIFSVVGDQNVESVNGFTGDDVLVDNFGLNNDGGLDVVLRNTASESVEVNSVNVTDGGDYTEFVGEREVDVGDTDNIELPFVSETEGTNDLDVEVDYSIGGLDNLQASGTITGGLQITETSTVSGTVSASPGWENVEVRIKDGETIEERVHTDENGEYSANIESGTYDFEAAGVEATSINADENIQLDFDLGSEEVIKDGTTETTFTTVTLNDCEADDRGPFDMTYAETSDGELQIASLDQLQCMDEGLGDDYVLTQDIDASGTSEWNGGSGFKPIGDDTDSFTGDFDGAGYEINGLTIETSAESEEIALFQTVDGSLIENVGIVNVDIVGYFQDTGALVGGGKNDFVIDNSYSTGVLSGDKDVGGLVGEILDNNGEIRNSYSEAKVETDNGRAGGLVGKSKGTVINSYATGDVDGGDFAGRTGGLIGYNNEGTVTNSYATGNVSGTESTGGLIGVSYDGPVTDVYATGDVNAQESGGLVGEAWSDFDLDNGFSTGDVTGTTYAGGLIGNEDARNGYSVTDSYWDDEASTVTEDGEEKDDYSVGGTALTTSEMQGSSAESNMDFDFESVWEVVDGDYPTLVNLP